MNAPRPTLTSRTSASAPSAIFLLMIDDAISGTLSIVPVTSRSAYSFLSAGARSAVCPTKHAAQLCRAPPGTRPSACRSGTRESTRACRWCRRSARAPGPELLGTSAPQAATMGTTMSDILSPTPPVLCLPTFTPGSDDRSTRRPDRTMASVSHAVSSGSSPRNTMAISSAAVWYSGIEPSVMPADQPVDLGARQAPALALSQNEIDDTHEPGSITGELRAGPTDARRPGRLQYARSCDEAFNAFDDAHPGPRRTACRDRAATCRVRTGLQGRHPFGVALPRRPPGHHRVVVAGSSTRPRAPPPAAR